MLSISTARSSSERSLPSRAADMIDGTRSDWYWERSSLRPWPVQAPSSRAASSTRGEPGLLALLEADFLNSSAGAGRIPHIASARRLRSTARWRVSVPSRDSNSAGVGRRS